MFERADQCLRGVGQRFMPWRIALTPTQRWSLDVTVLGLVAFLVWLEARTILRFVGLF
jgi:hypothetical protein